MECDKWNMMNGLARLAIWPIFLKIVGSELSISSIVMWIAQVRVRIRERYGVYVGEYMINQVD